MLKQLQKDLIELSTEERAKANAWFFKTGKGQYGEGDKFIGVTMPNIRKVAKRYLHLSLKNVETLLHSEIHEERMAALIIWTYQYEKADEKTRKQIYETYLKNTKWINNWDLVDVTTPKIVGMYILENPKEKEIIYKFAKSTDLWEKRIAILATFAFIKNNQFEDTLKISTLLLNDKHDLIHKAVGWMLRELGKRNQKVEEEFLKQHHKTMPRTMLRYAIERFSDGKKEFYMKK
tara:strand:- start:469 stop:1170 length:702 start_codon:yes stop_codon:yes gene_type:complete